VSLSTVLCVEKHGLQITLALEFSDLCILALFLFNMEALTSLS